MASQVGTPQLRHAQTHACMYGTYANRWKTRKHNAFGPIYWMGGDINEIIIIKSVHLSRGKQCNCTIKLSPQITSVVVITWCWTVHSRSAGVSWHKDRHWFTAVGPADSPENVGTTLQLLLHDTHTQPLLHATPSLLNAISKDYHWPLYKMSNC